MSTDYVVIDFPVRQFPTFQFATMVGVFLASCVKESNRASGVFVIDQ